MGVSTTNGSQFFIGGVAAATVTTITQFAALTYVEVNDVQDLGNFGDTSNAVKFTAIKDARARTFKGSSDAGTMAVVVGINDADAGQTAMDAAQADKISDYGFKVILNNKLTTGGTGAIRYFRGKVMSDPENLGNVDTVMVKTYNIAIVSAILKVPAA